MKFTTAYYLLVIYTTVIFRSLIPVINDAVSHIFDDAIHIATVQALQGDDHVEYEMAASSAENDNNKTHHPGADDTSVHTPVKEYELCDTCFFYGSTSLLRNGCNTTAVYLRPQLKPPQPLL